jgi:hypothetical protein
MYPSQETPAVSMREILRLDVTSPLSHFFAPWPNDNSWIREQSAWSELPAFLGKLALSARNLAKNPPKSVAQPNSPEGKLHHFVSELSLYFTRAYGTPLHDHVAAVASAVFSADVSPENVRRFTKYRLKRKDPEKVSSEPRDVLTGRKPHQ